jgi:GNAT superfamily N-acetyltransferase
MEWRLRRAGPADAEAAGMVATASFVTAFYDDLAIADLIAHVAANCSAARFAKWFADGETVVTLAEHPKTGVPIGYTVLTAPDLPGDLRTGDVELRRIYLLPMAWGTTLAADLLARAIDDARARRGDRILLGVYGRNFRAHRFYEKHGFQQVGTRQFMVGETLHDDFVYARAI